MSAFGPKRTCLVHRTCPLLGVKRTLEDDSKTVFEGQATGEENFKADETYHRRIARKKRER